MNDLPKEVVFKISIWKCLLKTLAFGVFGSFMFYIGVKANEDGSIEPVGIGFGVMSALLVFKLVSDIFRRPTLSVNIDGIVWGREFYGWHQIVNYRGVSVSGNRWIELYFEGEQYRQEPEARGVTGKITKFFKSYAGASFDVSDFSASNDQIEDAMDDYFFPARGRDPEGNEDSQP